jgi:aryl-alcohol dehydrogenase-like predicted oxidoreductase
MRHIGCSNYPAWRVTEALWTSELHGFARYETLQPHYNLVHRAEFERELADVCRAYGLGVIPYSPLAGGFLTGKYRKGQLVEGARLNGARRYFTDPNWAILDQMERFGKERGGYSISQVALAWVLSDPLMTSPIIGPRSMEQLQDNMGATQLKLTQDEKKILDEISRWS